MWELGPDVHQQLRVAYDKRLARFNEVRQEQDPSNMFVNATLEKLLLLRD